MRSSRSCACPRRACIAASQRCWRSCRATPARDHAEVRRVEWGRPAAAPGFGAVCVYRRLEASVSPYLLNARTPVSLIRLNDVSMEFDGRPVLREAFLKLRRGDRIGLIGKNGTGKTTFLELVLGRQEPTDGTVNV